MISKKIIPGAPELIQQLIRIETGLPITSREFEGMIQSALKFADKVLRDDRIQGDLRSYHRVEWEYWPYRFETAWEEVGGTFTILTFAWRDLYSGTSGNMKDTAQFRGMLIKADYNRREVWG